MFALHPFRLIGTRPKPTHRDRGEATPEQRPSSALAPTVDPLQAAANADGPPGTHPVDGAPEAATARVAAPEPAAATEDDHARPSSAIARVDPPGLRVVPLRPDGTWPLRRAMDRVPSPFRAFPFRSLHLARMMAPIDPRD